MEFDVFFYYGTGLLSLDVENAWDIEIGIEQPKRTLFYDRQEGSGICEYENFPNALAMTIGLRFDVAKWFAYRNNYVTNGEDDYPDRRIAVSQNYILIEQSGGEMDVSVYYIPFGNYKNPKTVTLPIGIIK